MERPPLQAAVSILRRSSITGRRTDLPWAAGLPCPQHTSRRDGFQGFAGAWIRNQGPHGTHQRCEERADHCCLRSEKNLTPEHLPSESSL